MSNRSEQSPEDQPLPRNPELARLLRELINQIDPSFLNDRTQISASRQKERILRDGNAETDWTTFRWHAGAHRETYPSGENIIFSVSQEMSGIVHVVPAFAKAAVNQYLTQYPDEPTILTYGDSIDFEVNLTTASIALEYNTSVYANGRLIASVDNPSAAMHDSKPEPESLSTLSDEESLLLDALEADFVGDVSGFDDDTIQQLEMALTAQEAAQTTNDASLPMAQRIITILNCMDLVLPT